MNKKVFIVLVVVMCGLAGALYWYCTPYGVGLTNDSSAYIGGARSMLAGLGYVRIGGDGLPRAITHFPPFYSIVLAGVSRVTGMDPLETAKWVNLVCAVLNQALFMGAALLLTGSCLTAFFAGIAFLCAGPVLQGHIYGLSEALYLTLFLIVFSLSVTAVRKRKTLLWLLIGLLTGCLVLTRYAGFAALGGLAVYALCVPDKWKERLTAFLLLLFGFAVPYGGWLLNENNGEASAVNRVISLHLPAWNKVEEGIRNFAGFFLPEYRGLVENFLRIWGVVIAVGLAALLLIVIVAGLRNFFRPSAKFTRNAWFAPALQGAAYAVMLGLNVCFLDGSTLFDNRILLPFYVCAMLLIFAVCGMWGKKSGVLRVLAVIFMIGWPVVLMDDEIDLIREFHRNGQGMAGEEWRESETRLAALEIPEEKILFSNRQTALYLLNDQPSYILPPMFDSASFQERESFELDRQWMAGEVLDGSAMVIVFNYQEMLEDDGDREWLEIVLEGLPIYQEYKDGAIFGK